MIAFVIQLGSLSATSLLDEPLFLRVDVLPYHHFLQLRLKASHVHVCLDSLSAALIVNSRFVPTSLPVGC